MKMGLIQITNPPRGAWYHKYPNAIFSAEKIDDFYRVDSGVYEAAHIPARHCKVIVNFQLEQVKKQLQEINHQVVERSNGIVFEVYKDEKFLCFAFSVEGLTNLYQKIISAH